MIHSLQLKKLIFITALLILPGLGFSLSIGGQSGSLDVSTLDGIEHSIENFSERKGTAIVFLSARCTATDRALETLIPLHESFRHKGFLFVGICSNGKESTQELKHYCQSMGIVFPVYIDTDGKTARQLGATVTPEIFILDKDGVLQFHGGLIEAGETLQGSEELQIAVSSIEEGKDIPITETEIQGTPVFEPGPQRPVVDRYESIAFSSELIFEKIPGAAAHHCSTIAELENGDLLCVWYGGSYESADDQVLYSARKKAGEHVWSAPQVLLQNGIQPPGNAVVFIDGKQRVWIIWGRMEDTRPLRRGGGWSNCRLMARVSNDQGYTWSKDRLMDENLYALPRNAPLFLSDGRLIVPLSGHGQGESGSFFLATNDNGATWQRSSFFKGGSQPTFIERNDGSLLAYMRNDPRIMQATSADGGKTWTNPVETVLRNPGAGIAMRKLSSGNSVIVFNDSETERTPLSIARSTDDGHTWEEPLHLESNPGEYSYPCVIQDSAGKIHITYTYRRYAIKHVEINETWLTHTQRPN